MLLIILVGLLQSNPAFVIIGCVCSTLAITISVFNEFAFRKVQQVRSSSGYKGGVYLVSPKRRLPRPVKRRDIPILSLTLWENGRPPGRQTITATKEHA